MGAVRWAQSETLLEWDLLLQREESSFGDRSCWMRLLCEGGSMIWVLAGRRWSGRTEV